MMKLGEMLSDLKKEKEDLKRLRELRRETFWVEKKEKPVIDTLELNEKIQEK